MELQFLEPRQRWITYAYILHVTICLLNRITYIQNNLTSEKKDETAAFYGGKLSFQFLLISLTCTGMPSLYKGVKHFNRLITHV